MQHTLFLLLLILLTSGTLFGAKDSLPDHFLNSEYSLVGGAIVFNESGGEKSFVIDTSSSTISLLISSTRLTFHGFFNLVSPKNRGGSFDYVFGAAVNYTTRTVKDNEAYLLTHDATFQYHVPSSSSHRTIQYISPNAGKSDLPIYFWIREDNTIVFHYKYFETDPEKWIDITFHAKLLPKASSPQPTVDDRILGWWESNYAILEDDFVPYTYFDLITISRDTNGNPIFTTNAGFRATNRTVAPKFDAMMSTFGHVEVTQGPEEKNLRLHVLSRAGVSGEVQPKFFGVEYTMDRYVKFISDDEIHVLISPTDDNYPAIFKRKQP